MENSQFSLECDWGNLLPAWKNQGRDLENSITMYKRVSPQPLSTLNLSKPKDSFSY